MYQEIHPHWAIQIYVQERIIDERIKDVDLDWNIYLSSLGSCLVKISTQFTWSSSLRNQKQQQLLSKYSFFFFSQINKYSELFMVL